MVKGISANLINLDLSQLQGLVLDIDGILYEGDYVLPGAAELIEYLNHIGFPYVLFSNNSTRRFSDHEAKLKSMGMAVPPEKIITSAIVTAQVLAQESQPGARCLVIGEAGLQEAMQTVGFDVTLTGWEGVAYVVVGMDRTLTYEKLLAASRAIRRGAQLISSNPDPVYPTGDEIIPASGAIQVAIEVSTGMKARVTGKPEKAGFLIALQRLGTPPGVTAMVGDQPNIDLLGAHHAGMKSILVLSTLTPTYDPSHMQVIPDGVFQNTLAFYEAWIQR